MKCVQLGLTAVAALLITTGVLGTQASAMPSPQQVLDRARLSRADYIQVLGEVQGGAPSLSDRTLLYPYINELDELRTIGDGYDMGTVGSGPLGTLAFTLTRAAIKFASLSQDSIAQLTTVLRWATDDVRAEIGSAQHIFISRADGPHELLVLHYDVGLLIDALKDLHASGFVIDSFEDLQSDATIRLMPNIEQLANVDVMRLIRAERSAAGFETFFSGLERRVLATNDIGFLKLALSWALAGATQLGQIESVPYGTAGLPGDLANEIVPKLLSLGDTADPSLAVQIVGIMSEHQLSDYLQMIVEATREHISQNQVEFLFLSLRAMALRFEKAGMTQQLLGTQTLMNRVAFMRASGFGSYEGVYPVTVGDNAGTLTIADTGDSNFIMCLRLDFGATPVYYSLFNVVYNFRDDTYEAHRFAVDDPRYVMPNWPDWYMKFKFTGVGENLQINGTFANTQHFWAISGQREALFKRDWDVDNYPMDNVSGRYEATSGLGDGAHKASLVMSQVGFKLAGTLRIDYGAALVDFVYGYLNREQGRFRITSAELGNGRWVQIRGQVIGDGSLVSDYIVGGEGIHFNNMTLLKIEN